MTNSVKRSHIPGLTISTFDYQLKVIINNIYKVLPIVTPLGTFMLPFSFMFEKELVNFIYANSFI